MWAMQYQHYQAVKVAKVELVMLAQLSLVTLNFLAVMALVVLLKVMKMNKRFVFMDEHELLKFFGKSKRKNIYDEEYETNDFDEHAGALVDTVEKRILIDLGYYTSYYPTAGSLPSDEDKEMLEKLLNGDKDESK